MAEIVEYLAGERLQLGRVVDRDKKRIAVVDERDRRSKIDPDKVVFRHSGDSIEQVDQRLARQAEQVDVALIWEALAEEQDWAAREAAPLARLFFDADDALHASAVFRALGDDRLFFRRRGLQFEPRRPDEIEQLKQQRESEARAAAEQQALQQALRRRAIDDALADRLQRYVRGQPDKALQAVLELSSKEPERQAFELLLGTGRLPPNTDFEVLQARLSTEQPPEVIAWAEQRELTAPAAVEGAAFSIDDPETREVDDALSAEMEGELLRVQIDIADVALYVEQDDPVDREARRRATTIYLPTRTYYMLPEVIGAQRASLQRGQPRPTVCTTVWLDAEGEVVRHRLSRRWVAVARRLDYEQADRLLAEGDDAGADGDAGARAALRLLQRAAGQLRARRVAEGALLLQRPEWKIRVEDEGQRVVAKPIAHDSASRQLVAEMMILANRLGAQMASEARLPVIYRVQAAPAEPLPKLEPGDPAAFAKLRGLLAPAQLSLNPGAHFGLGLPAYTQVTSPLRRYGDLVQQRQLTAHLAGEAPPYDAESLLRVLATVEAVEQESKKIEAAVTQRWALEFVDRLQDKRGLAARVVGEANKGYRLALLSCGAQGTVVSRRPQQIGDELRVDVEQVKPRRGLLRLRLAE